MIFTDSSLTISIPFMNSWSEPLGGIPKLVHYVKLHANLYFFTFISQNEDSKRCPAPQRKRFLPSIQDLSLTWVPNPIPQFNFIFSITSLHHLLLSRLYLQFLGLCSFLFLTGKYTQISPINKNLKRAFFIPKRVAPHPSFFPFQSGILKYLLFSHLTSPILFFTHGTHTSAFHSKSTTFTK